MGSLILSNFQNNMQKNTGTLPVREPSKNDTWGINGEGMESALLLSKMLISGGLGGLNLFETLISGGGSVAYENGNTFVERGY